VFARRKDAINELQEEIVADHQSGKGQKDISEQFGVHYYISSETFKTIANHPRRGQSSKFITSRGSAMLREDAKNP